MRPTILAPVFMGPILSLAASTCLAGSPYEVHCKEALPVFTLGEKSNATKEQETALCSCIWNQMSQSERATSLKAREGKELDFSPGEIQAFSQHFGELIQKCGGMKL